MPQFKTKDIYEAAAFIARNIKILRLEKEENFFWFLFTDPSCSEISNAYWNDELLIPAKKYADAIRSLKDRVFSNR